MLAGKCQLAGSTEIPNINLRARLETLGATTLMGCPVDDVLGRMLGAIIIQWDAPDTVPQGETLYALMG